MYRLKNSCIGGPGDKHNLMHTYTTILNTNCTTSMLNIHLFEFVSVLRSSLIMLGYVFSVLHHVRMFLQVSSDVSSRILFGISSLKTILISENSFGNQGPCFIMLFRRPYKNNFTNMFENYL